MDSGAGAGGGAGAGAGLGAGVVTVDELPRAHSISAVRRDNCQPPWKGLNSIGKVNLPLFAWAVLTLTVAVTLDGFLSDHAMLFATKVIGR